MERKMSKGRTIRNNLSGGGGGWGEGGEKFLVLEFFLRARLSAGIFS